MNKLLISLIFLSVGIMIGWIAFNESDSPDEQNSAQGNETQTSVQLAPLTKTDASEQTDKKTINDSLFSFEQKFDHLLEGTEPISTDQTIELLKLIRAMDSDDLFLAMEKVQGAADGHTFTFCAIITHNIFGLLLDQDPRAAEEYFRSGSNALLGSGNDFRKMLNRTKAEQNLNQSIAELDSIEDVSERREVLSIVLDIMAEKSPRDAYALLGSRTEAVPLDYSHLFERWVSKDLNEAATQLNQIPQGAVRQNALKGFISGLAEDAPTQATAFVEGLKYSEDKRIAIGVLSGSLLKEDLKAGLDYIFSLEDEQIRGEVLLNNINVMAAEDPEQAYKYLQMNLSSEQRDDAIVSLVQHTVGNDIQAALDLVNILPYGHAYDEAVEKISMRWSHNDPEAAATWAQGLEDGDGKRMALNFAYSNLARQNPEAAKKHYLTLYDLDQKKRLASDIFNQISSRDRQKALEWVESLLEPEVVKSIRR